MCAGQRLQKLARRGLVNENAPLKIQADGNCSAIGADGHGPLGPLIPDLVQKPRDFTSLRIQFEDGKCTAISSLATHSQREAVCRSRQGLEWINEDRQLEVLNGDRFASGGIPPAETSVHGDQHPAVRREDQPTAHLRGNRTTNLFAAEGVEDLHLVANGDGNALTIR